MTKFYSERWRTNNVDCLIKFLNEPQTFQHWWQYILALLASNIIAIFTDRLLFPRNRKR
jgi:hypothetical protein